jgi:hypothetical protein
MAGTLYFIQPAELVGTNRYKIGCSASNDMIRCKSYKKGTRYMMILECHQPFVVEDAVKKEFNARFSRIAGKEYFEGDEEEMRTLFYNIYLQHEGRSHMEIDEPSPICFTRDTELKIKKTTSDKVDLKNAVYKNGKVFAKGGKIFSTIHAWAAACDPHPSTPSTPYYKNTKGEWVKLE